MNEKKITIFDVASRAGVSKGTVDRVLHGRGEVSKKTAVRVRKAIDELGYQPNIYASLLASKKTRIICCLLPTFAEGEYWEKIYNGFIAGGKEVSNLNIGTSVFSYDQYDSESFRETCSELLESNPDGVVIPPLYKEDTETLVKELHSRDIPYVYVDTKLDDDGYLAYYGMPMYKSGSLCASLLTDRKTSDEVKDILVIRVKRDKSSLSDPTLERRKGFSDFIKEFSPECRIHNVYINPSDKLGNEKALDDFFTDHPGIKYVVMFNSRIHLVAHYLEKHKCSTRCVIGYDDLSQNLDALRDGSVSILIAQHTENQSKSAVATLSDYILKHQEPSRRDNYMHMDILTRLNVENY